MSNLRVFDPFSIEPFDEALRGWLRPAMSWQTVPTIKLDVNERPDAYVVTAEIPGVKKEEISVQISGDTVSISAEVKREKDEKQGGKLLRSERSYGVVSRSMSFDAEIDRDRAEAKYDNGVLELLLPKRAGAAAKRLSIR